MPTLFVLLPSGTAVEALLGDQAPAAAARGNGLRVHRHPPASDGRHLLSLLRARRDPVATRWRRGMAACVLGGALLGLLTNGVLAGAFGMFGGLLDLALPLGFFLGAFLGGFTGAMTGTESARDELQQLARQVTAGDVLVQVAADEPRHLEPLLAACARNGWATAVVGP